MRKVQEFFDYAGKKADPYRFSNQPNLIYTKEFI